MLEVNGVILTVCTACDEVFLPGIWKYPISDILFIALVTIVI